MTHAQQTNDRPKPCARLKLSSTLSTLTYFLKSLPTISSSSSPHRYSMRTSSPTPPSPSRWPEKEGFVLRPLLSVKLTSRNMMESISRKVCTTSYPRPSHVPFCGRTRIASSASEDRLMVNMAHGLRHVDKEWRPYPTATPRQIRHHITSGGISRDLPAP